MTDFSKGFFGVERITIRNEHLEVDYVIRPAGEKVIRRVTTDFLWGHQVDPEISGALRTLSDVLKQKAVDTFSDLKVDLDPTPSPVQEIAGQNDDGSIYSNG